MKNDLIEGLNLLYKQLYKETVLVSNQSGEVMIHVDDILSVVIDDHYLSVFTENQEYMIRETLGNFVNKY